MTRTRIRIAAVLWLSMVVGHALGAAAQELPADERPEGIPAETSGPMTQDTGEEAGAQTAQAEEAGGRAAEAVVPPGEEAPLGEKKISLDLKGVDLIELFRILSLKTGYTIVPTKAVSGRVNIFLNNLTFEEVLDIVLVSQDLAQERKGDILYIMTAEEYQQLYGEKYNEKRSIRRLNLGYAKPSAIFEALSQLKSDIGKIVVDEASGVILLIDVPEKLALMEQTARELDRPPQMEIFDLKYSKSGDMKAHLTDALTDGPGKLLVDERSNKAMVMDLPGKMEKLKQIVQAFDAEPQQVFIEAEIVQVTLNDQFQSGINWDEIFTEFMTRDLRLIGTFPVSPALSAKQQIKIGTLAQDKFEGTLELLKTYGDTKILSRPRIAAINNQEAKILVGAREAYVTQTLSQAQASTVTSESIEFVDVGVKLNVLPTINKDGFITMKIKPEVSNVRETITTALGSRIPIVETSESETVVKIKDGTMIMIAGLMKEELRKDRRGTPRLANLPLLGVLFSTRSDQKKTTELIIFLRPRLMSGALHLAATEPEEWIPVEVTPPDLKDTLVSKMVADQLDAIRVEPAAPPGAAPEAPQAQPAMPEGDALRELHEKLKKTRTD